MRRTTLLLATMALTLLMIAGVAWAATVQCRVNYPCVGTDEPDKLIGTNQADSMDGKGDGDVLLGGRGADSMEGDSFNFGAGTPADGNDKVYGNAGSDLMWGGGGSDLLRGGNGGEPQIDAREPQNNPGEDTVTGDGGDDFIVALDSFKDTIDCGDGEEDIVLFDDGIDVVADN